jgi:signal transduction histidine kinase
MNALLTRVVTGFRYVKSHPQILFALMLLIVIPLLFLYTGQQFLEAGKTNQDRLQKDRIGMMQDSLALLLSATNFNTEQITHELEKFVAQNPDITDYIIAQKTASGTVPLLAHDKSQIGKPVTDETLFQNAALRTDESIIFEYYDESNNRTWSAYRAVRTSDGEFYFIETTISLATIDAVIAQRENAAYYSLAFVYLFLLALAYWHIKLTDYQYLYTEAQKAIETKDLFTNMIAHELRAPLTAIHGYAGILAEHFKNDDTSHEQAVRIEDSADRLITIVNDLLDVARIQSGKLALQTANVDISPIITTVVRELEVLASQKGSQVSAHLRENAHFAFVDGGRFEQVLTNIISNAIKYTEKGQIAVAVTEGRKTIEIRVQDTGMGISSEDQKKLFAPFFRVTNESMSTITGTGLGMWITKQLVELMGGTIGVESIKGVGTHIVVTLPKQQSQ